MNFSRISWKIIENPLERILCPPINNVLDWFTITINIPNSVPSKRHRRTMISYEHTFIFNKNISTSSFIVFENFVGDNANELTKKYEKKKN